MNKAQIAPYEQRLEMIQEEYLQKHFQQVAIVLAKHYHYAFQLLKHLHRANNHHAQTAFSVLDETVKGIVMRKKKVILAYLVRRDEEIQYNRSKACIVLSTLLLRKVVGMQVHLIAALSTKDTKKSIPKEQQLFLIIKLSNLAKLLSFAKADAFYMIRLESWLRLQEVRKASLNRLAFTLNSYVNRLIIDSFLSIANPHTLNTHDTSSEDDEEILIQTFKAMAVSLNRLPKAKATPLTQIKKEMGAKQLFSFLREKKASLMQWCFSDIACLDNHKYRSSTLEVLRRQIAILEQQYESV